MTRHGERRTPQRIRLQSLLKGAAGNQRIFVVDVSLKGLRIAHQEMLGAEGSSVDVMFEWHGRKIRLQSEVRWSQIKKPAASSHAKPVWHSGVRITRFVTEESGALLRELVLHHVLLAIDEQKANARGIPAVAAQSFQTGAATVYRRHELINGQWRAQSTSEKRQPANGFTVSADHPPAEIEMLRSAYETADRAGAEMIRKMAEMSISSEDGIPTRRYEP